MTGVYQMFFLLSVGCLIFTVVMWWLVGLITTRGWWHKIVSVTLLSLLCATILIGGMVGQASAQPEPTPIVVAGLAEAIAEADPDAEPGDVEPGEDDDESGPSLFERALCGISPALCGTAGLAGIPTPGEALSDLGEAAADSILDKLAASTAEAVAWALESSFGRAATLLGVLWQTIRLTITRSAQTVVDLSGSLLTIGFVSASGWLVVTMFAEATDAWSRSLIVSAIGNDQAIDNIAAGLMGMPPMVTVMLGVLMFVSAQIQDWLLAIREAAVLLISGALPSLASARLFGWGRPWLGRAINTLLSVLLWKPVAAATIFGAIALLGQGSSARPGNVGAAMMFLSIFILPAMMKLFAHHDIGGGIVNGGGGGRALATGTVVAAGAVMTAGGSAALRGAAAASSASSGSAPQVRVQDAPPRVPPAPTNRWDWSGSQPAAPRVPPAPQVSAQ